jgi:hypothetical protein
MPKGGLGWEKRSRLAAAMLVFALLLCACAATPALAAFPYTHAGGEPGDYTDLYLTPSDPAPNDLGGDGNTFKFASTPDSSNGPQINNNPVELNGVRGGWLADANRSAPQAVNTTLGRPDVTIAVLDSGIEWNNVDAMNDLRRKVRLNKRELPAPNHADSAPVDASLMPAGITCADFSASYDANGDGVFNVADYDCDSHINLSDSRRVGPSGKLVPQDVILAFSDGSDGFGGNLEGNGYVDDIAGWDFLDNDNDPFDDVQYGHGTGEAKDSSSEANNNGEGGDQMGSCPNCMVLPLRVGDSFIADVNHFAQATLYATDNNVQVVQEALGALNNSSLARAAVDYAYRHGVTVIASAADEAAQHNNWPSSLPHVILVNSVTDSPLPAPNHSYLAFNGCTNFNSKITLAIPSTSCSSNATGLAAGMAGLVYSAAYTAYQKGALGSFPDTSLCRLTAANPVSGNDRCLITPNEVRQLMASGTIDPPPAPFTHAYPGPYQSDDVDFAGAGGPGPTYQPDSEVPSCSPAPTPGCTDPNGALQTIVNTNRGPSLLPLPPAEFQSYPARRGDDQFYGYGRVNMAKAVRAVLSSPTSPGPSHIPPDVEISSPQWYQQVNPAQATLAVSGQVDARLAAGQTFTCQVYVAPGHYPNNRLTTDSPPGDFKPVGNGACNGTTPHSGPIDGVLSSLNLGDLKSRFPPETQATGFTGREPGGSAQTSNGRPNTDPYGFEVRVVATTTTPGPGSLTMSGEDMRAAFLHRDQDMLPGFPKGIVRGAIGQGTPTGDGESSPVLADLDGDNRNELIVAGSDGFVHALRPDGTELPGWPVRGDRPPLHTGERAFQSGEVSSNVGGAIVGSMAVQDVNHDGVPEVFAGDLEGKLYGWRAGGTRFFTQQANPAFSGKPVPGHPFPRYEPAGQADLHRTEHGFISSPVLADLDGSGQLELVAAGMDRHLYAWHMDGSPVQGFPVLVVDPSKVDSVDPTTDQVTFRSDAGSFMQGAIVDTPAVADLTGDSRPEVVVGTNEEYDASGTSDGGFNASAGSEGNVLTQAQSGIADFKQRCAEQGGGELCDNLPDVPLKPANGRLYAIHPDGAAHAGGALLSGWPAKVGILNAELLPVVGEGITGYPVVAAATCGGTGGPGPKIGVIANNGEGYVFDPQGQSCFGRDSSGHDVPVQTDGYAQPDHPMLPAVGLPAFADLGAGMTMFAPAAGLGRALDVALPEYQRTGQDFLAAWSLQGGGTVQPNFPQPVNDLQFLTGPSIADLDGNPGQEIVEGTASKDLAAFNALGAPLNTRWPKVTTDWTVANPTIGTFGDAGGGRKVVIALTRSGYINAYSTAAPPCTSSEWPRFHHDNANSGDHSRDATPPSKPTALGINGNTFSFSAPGDDYGCGTANRYEIVTSGSPITPQNFAAAQPLANPPAPAAAGTGQTYTLPAHQRYVAIRAIDEAGNVGWSAQIDTGPVLGKISARGTVQTAQGPAIGFSAANNCIAAQSTQPSIVGTGSGGRIWTKTTVTQSTCTDQPPASPLHFDTQSGTATGTFGPAAPGGRSGQQGTLTWTYYDNASDKVQFTLKDSSSTTVYQAAQQTPTAYRGASGGVWTFGP